MNFKYDSALRRTALAAASLIMLSASLPAQTDASQKRFSPQAEGYMQRARNMLEAGNYAGVIDQLKTLETRNTDFSLLDALSPKAKEDYVYMLAEALYQRGDEECVGLLRSFVRDFPASPLALKARLSIADFYFFRHQWQKALDEYNEIDFGRLNRNDLSLYTYRKALALLKTGSYDQASSLIRRIADIPRYREAAKFYEAYIDYAHGDLDKAYRGFSNVKEDIDGLDPRYYLAQIDFSREEYSRVISIGNSLLEKGAEEQLLPEIKRIVGLSYFKRGDMRKARPYLEAYLKAVPDNPEPAALYAVAVADYEDADYQAATDNFMRLTDLESDLGQSAWLYIGQCDIKSGNPDAAAMAFEKAARMNYDPDVTETALYNNAAAVTRGGKIPFASSADMLERFISSYPDSEYTPKVEEYLATAYYNDRDYTKALRSINAIRKPSPAVLAAKQKILYELGVERMSNGDPAGAAEALLQSVALASHSPEIAAQARLWLGDALYAQMDYKGARDAYARAAKELGKTSNRALALYDCAYASYMLSDYKSAAADFRKALDASPSLPSVLADDAIIRRADCLYYTGNYAEARDAYARAVERGAADSDYAAFRHAVMLGLGNDIKGKLAELAAIESKFPDSKWLPQAALERALTFESLGQNENAVKGLREVALKYPDAAQARKALLNLALADSKAGKVKEAAEAYREIITRWPSSEEAALANDDLKKYYASTGDLREYADFLRGVPGARQLDADEMERLSFDGAEIAYTDNIKDITLLLKYVNDYPDGKYLAQALLDLATSYESQKKYEEAEEVLSSLVSSRPHSPQYPEALLMKGEILEKNLGRKKDALIAYKELEKTADPEFMPDAVSGIMRTTSDPSERIEYARRARNSGGLPADRIEEASFYEAEALLESGRKSDAVKILRVLASNPAGETGAKAAVTLARHYLDVKDYDNALQTALDFTDAGSPHEYWLAQGFIALADAYHAKGQTSLAKEYLKSLRDNYPGKEKDIATAISTRLKTWK